MTLVRGRALTVSLGERQVLSGLDLDIAAGEIVGLIGPNGAGKTTLIKAMAGLLSLQSGAIHIKGRLLREIGRGALARILAYLPQGGESHWALSVEALVMLGRLPHMGSWNTPSEADRAAVKRALLACDVWQFKDRPATRLSGGEQTRVLLARALASEPKLLLADEPVAGLDPAHQLDVMGRLRDLARSGAGVVVVMHDLTLAARYCDRLALLHDKRIAAEGSPLEVLSPDVLARCYGIRVHLDLVEGNTIVVPLERIRAKTDHAAT